jgi:hypothetical protein
MKKQKHIAHYGVIGMKWGKRKAKEISNFVSKKVGDVKKADSDNRAKMLSLAKSKDSAGTSDRSRFYNASKPLGIRALNSLKSEARSAIIGVAIQTVATGKSPSLNNVAKNVLTKSAKRLTVDAILANSASKKYDSNGNLKPRFKNQGKGFSRSTREDKLNDTYKIASASIKILSPFMKVALSKKIKNWSQEKQAIRKARESVFEKAVLERRVPVWNSEDGSMSIFEP